MLFSDHRTEDPLTIFPTSKLDHMPILFGHNEAELINAESKRDCYGILSCNHDAGFAPRYVILTMDNSIPSSSLNT